MEIPDEGKVTQSVLPDNLTAALEYAARGWRVLPVYLGVEENGKTVCTCAKRFACPTPGKHPIPPNGLHDATTDPAIIRHWFSDRFAQVAVACGRESNLMVVDIDPRHDGDKTLAGLEVPLKRGLAARTGGGGGHCFYRYAELPTSGKLGPGIDFQSDGRYVVVTPSLHISGQQYEWLNDDALGDPAWILESFPEKAKAKQLVRRKLNGKGSPEGALRLLGQYCDRLLFLKEGGDAFADGRNAELNKAAYTMGGLVGSGLIGRDVVAADLRAAAVASGLPDGEIERVLARSLDQGEAAAFVPAPPVNVDPSDPGGDWSELGIARRVLEVLEADTVETVYDMGALYRYRPDRGYWKPVRDEEIKPIIHGWHRFQSFTGPKPKRLLISHRLAENAQKMMVADRLSEGFFETRLPGVALANGRWLDGTLLPHTHEARLLFSLPFAFDPAAECPRFRTFLGQVLSDESILAVQEFFGAALLCQATTYRRCLLLYGEGHNGKSQVIDILTAMFPPSVVRSIPPHAMGDLRQRANLAMAHLNTVSEMPASELRDSEPLKAILDGSTISGAHVYERAITFRSRCACVFAANVLPVVRDQTAAFWDRFLPIPFRKRVATKDRIVSLGAKIAAAEGPGIVNWALIGWLRLQRHGEYTLGVDSEQLKQEWRIESDPVARWAEEKCEKTGETTSGELYFSFRAWLARNGHQSMSSALFGRRLRYLGYRRRKSKGQQVWNLEISKTGTQ